MQRFSRDMFEAKVETLNKLSVKVVTIFFFFKTPNHPKSILEHIIIHKYGDIGKHYFCREMLWREHRS